MAQITDILSTLDELLRPGDFDDLGPNGLQVPGALEITTVSGTQLLVSVAVPNRDALTVWPRD